jgi:hypothetical protein
VSVRVARLSASGTAALLRVQGFAAPSQVRAIRRAPPYHKVAGVGSGRQSNNARVRGAILKCD